MDILESYRTEDGCRLWVKPDEKYNRKTHEFEDAGHCIEFERSFDTVELTLLDLKELTKLLEEKEK